MAARSPMREADRSLSLIHAVSRAAIRHQTNGFRPLRAW
jgi:hypothetical protein